MDFPKLQIIFICHYYLTLLVPLSDISDEKKHPQISVVGYIQQINILGVSLDFDDYTSSNKQYIKSN